MHNNLGCVLDCIEKHWLCGAGEAFLARGEPGVLVHAHLSIAKLDPSYEVNLKNGITQKVQVICNSVTFEATTEEDMRFAAAPKARARTFPK